MRLFQIPGEERSVYEKSDKRKKKIVRRAQRCGRRSDDC
jgi:hypothetical protein